MEVFGIIETTFDLKECILIDTMSFLSMMTSKQPKFAF